MSVICFISNIWRSKSNNSICVISCFRYKTIKQQFLTDWNITKMKYNGKGEIKWIISVLFIFYQKLWNILIYSLVYRFEINSSRNSSLAEFDLLPDLCGWGEKGDIDRRKYCMYSWDRLECNL